MIHMVVCCWWYDDDAFCSIIVGRESRVGGMDYEKNTKSIKVAVCGRVMYVGSVRLEAGRF